MGCAMQQGTTGTNIARKALLRAGLPVTMAGTDHRSPVCIRLAGDCGWPPVR